MRHVAWLAFAVLSNALLLLVVTVAATYLLARQESDASRDRAAWRRGALDLAGEVERTAATVDPPADLDQVARQLLPLSGRIRRHVRAAPASVERPVYRGLFELGLACRRVAMAPRPTTELVAGASPEERLDDLEAEATALWSTVEDG